MRERDRARDRGGRLCGRPQYCQQSTFSQANIHTTQEPHLDERLDVPGASERVARFLTAMTMEISLLAKACGKSSVHNLEVEDLRALSLEASAFTGVRLAGIDRPFTW